MTRRRSPRRRGGGDAVTTIYWRDIPAQVTATIDGVTAKGLLEPRFQHAIDRAATVADLTETEAYVAQWRREANPIDEGASADPAAETVVVETVVVETVVAETVTELTAAYPRHRLEALVATGGVEPASPSRPATEIT